jgi:hypothetical protein
MSKKLERKTIEISRKKIPLRSLMHGKEIRDAAAAVEQFRMKLNEQEFLYGAKITIDWEDYGSVYAVARRPETDNEYADRLERARIAEELKKERELKRKLAAEQKAREAEFRKRASAVETIRKMAKENGLSPDQLIDLLSKEQA